MSDPTILRDICYHRSHATLESMCDPSPEAKAELFRDGQVQIISRPFCVDVHIRLFGGENTFFLSLSGGHGLSALLVHSPVDSPHHVLYNGYSFDIPKGDGTDDACGIIRRKLLETCEHHLPVSVVTVLVEKGILTR